MNKSDLRVEAIELAHMYHEFVLSFTNGQFAGCSSELFDHHTCCPHHIRMSARQSELIAQLETLNTRLETTLQGHVNSQLWWEQLTGYLEFDLPESARLVRLASNVDMFLYLLDSRRYGLVRATIHMIALIDVAPDDMLKVAKVALSKTELVMINAVIERLVDGYGVGLREYLYQHKANHFEQVLDALLIT